MKLIVGLGNPGLRYRNTRHNAGFLVIGKLSGDFGIPLKKKKYKGLLGTGLISGEKTGLFMPQTYMNLSGEAVFEAVKKGRINPKDTLVVCDDIDLKYGIIRIREKGGSAGHNGLKSIIEHLGTNDFPRLRVGIGQEPKPDNVVDFVLKPFNSAEKSGLASIIEEAAECALAWLKEGSSVAMAKFNKRQAD